MTWIVDERPPPPPDEPPARRPVPLTERNGWVHEGRPRHAVSRAGLPVRLAVVMLFAAALAGGAAGGVAGSLTSRTAETVPTAAPPAGATPGATAGQDLPVVVARASRSVVDIAATSTEYVNGRPTTRTSAGSGFVYDPAGLVATNAHVVGDADDVGVTLADGSSLRGEVLGRDTESDLAVVRIGRRALALPMGSSAAVRVGDFVVAAGNALALEGSPTITVGIVSALDRSITTRQGELTGLIQTDAAISSGDSGGPLLTPSGEVIGITTAGAASQEGAIATNIGFAIPIDTAKPVLDELDG